MTLFGLSIGQKKMLRLRKVTSGNQVGKLPVILATSSLQELLVMKFDSKSYISNKK